MIVYLDQNKWIELAKIFHEKDKSERAKSIQKKIEASLEYGYIYPLSEVHYMEFSRIRNNERRSRLGRAMWEYSKGKTLVSGREIVEREVEIGLQGFIPEIKPSASSILKIGIA